MKPHLKNSLLTFVASIFTQCLLARTGSSSIRDSYAESLLETLIHIHK